MICSSCSFIFIIMCTTVEAKIMSLLSINMVLDVNSNLLRRIM